MEAAAEDLLAALSSPSSHAGLHARFAAYLEPLVPHIPSSNPNPKPPPKRTAKQKQQQQEPQLSDAITLRPLAKRFLPFLLRALQLLPPLVRTGPASSGEAGGGGPDELIEIYKLLLDCLSAVSPCLMGKPYSVLIQRGRFVRSLESRGHFARAEAEAVATIDALRSVLSPPTTSTKSRRGAASATSILPDPGVAGEAGMDPEVTILAVELTVSLANSAVKGHVKEGAPYERVLSLVQHLQPWLRILDEDVNRKYLTRLANAMSCCILLLVSQPSFFNADLVHGFCVATLEQFAKAQMIERFLAVARKICSSLDLSWSGSTKFLLDLLNNAIDSVVHVKADLPNAVNELLVFVAYFSHRFHSAHRDLRFGASELLYKQGGYFSEVSPSTASVLLLYATGFYFRSWQAENEENPCMSADVVHNEKNLQILKKALGALEHFFPVTNRRSIPLHSSTKDSNSLHQEHSHRKNNSSQSNDDVSFVAYLESLEFVSMVLLQQTDTIWNSFSDGKAVHYSGNMDYILTTLHQFSDSSLAAYSTKLSEGDNERLHEQRGTLLRVLISVIKISFAVNKNIQKSMSFVSRAVSSSWLTFKELKFLISSLAHIGAALHRTGHFEEATKALELCCQTIWAHVRLSYCTLSAKTDGSKIIDVPPECTLKDIIVDSFARIAKMVDILHRCGAKMTHEIVAKSLSELLSCGNVSEYFSSCLILIKLWVKVTCKDFKDEQGVDGAPLLYHSLLSYPSPLPVKLVGLIVEQELLAYGLMETRSTFCVKMQMRIIDVLIDEIYCSKEFDLERSRVLIRKAGTLRASGVKHIQSCLEYLSEAISLLDSFRDNTNVINQLAVAYCLYAHCAQEGNLDVKVILENAENAYKLWSRTGSLEQPPTTILPLLCSLVDIFSLKGRFELQFDLCKLMIKIWKQEKLPLEKLFLLLFTNGRLSHACCHSPVDQQFISYAAEHLGVNFQHTEFWSNCFKEDLPYFAVFLQRMLCSDLFSSQSWHHLIKRQFDFDASIDAINKAAASLVSEVPTDEQSLFIASHLYHDLSERLFSGGQIFKAFSYGKEALNLRRKLLKKKFKLTSAETGNEESQRYGQGFVSLEVWGPTIAEIWPDSTRATSTKDSFLTPWNVLRCYLESTLQVAVINELIGNGSEAEALLRSGKEISIFHDFPVFCIAFTSLLGQLFCKRQLWEEAEGELKYARDLLAKYNAVISCKLCKLTLDISIDMQVGDQFWSLYEKDSQRNSATNLSSSFGMYQSAMEKLNNSGLEFLAGSYGNLKTGCTKYEVGNFGKESLVSKDDMLPSCHVSLLLGDASLDHSSGSITVNGRKKNARNTQADAVLDVKAKRTSARLAKVQNSETNAKTRTRSKRTTNVKPDKASTDSVDCSKDDTCCMFGCWNCLFKKSLASGHIQNILQFRWDCVRRRYLVSLLLKIARVSGAQKGHRGAHEVHCLYWQCISLLYFRSLPQSYYKFYEPHFITVLMNGHSDEFLPLERAEILLNISFFLLKGVLSEQSRGICCSFSDVEISDVVPWLLKAFVLSRESPLLLQEVCKLLACIFLLSTVDSSIQLPLFSQGSLSLNHWAAYFHQISVGTHFNCQYLATLQFLPKENISKGSIVDFRKETDADVPKFPRFASVDIQHIEKHIIEFFDKLPDVPILCISVFGDDYVNVLGDALLIPSPFPAWLLLTRFDSTSKPTTMFLPVDAISEEIQPDDFSIKDLSASEKKWQCPWGYSITDYMVPAFRNILQENFISLSSGKKWHSLTTNDVQAKTARWWSHRMKLNMHLDNVLKGIEESWLGPWKCLLLGRQLADENIEAVSSNIIVGLESEFKLEINPALIKAILGGVVSVDTIQECVYQLILYKGYFGMGGCCGKDRLRAFSSHQIVDKALDKLKSLIKDTVKELPEPLHREPVIFVLDINVQMLPWENLPVLRNQEIYRMPSMGSVLFALARCNNQYKDNDLLDLPFPIVDPLNTFYLLNPSGDLNSTQKEFDQLFRNYEWKGKAGSRDPIKAEELMLALLNHDLFVYLGHGSGNQYISGKEIEKLNNCAAALLMGCSSGTLHCKGSYAPRGAPLSYLSAGSPAIIANLWDVSDKDIDRFSKALLDSWLQEHFEDANNCSECYQLTQELEALNINDKNNRRTKRIGTREKSQKINDSANCCSCRRRRIATYLNVARRACKLPLLIGAAPVCYGLPTIIRKK